MDKLEFKNITGSVKDIDSNKRIVTGYLSSFNNKDHDGDIMLKSAVQKTISLGAFLFAIVASSCALAAVAA